jgi:hypothetical protein
MIRQIQHLLLTVLMICFIGPAVFAAERVALLIGNSKYDNKALSLRNPVNDVSAMSKSLSALGFVVITAQDASISDMQNALSAFEKQLEGAQLGLFFYAGHGSQVSGENFLLATDFADPSFAGIKSASLTLSTVREVFARAKPAAGVVILDACRNNPLNIKLDSGETQVGLARTKGTTGLLVAYATDPGNVAFEGTGENSIFTTALLKHLGEPGLDIRLMFGRVRQDVVLSSRGAQVPWVEESLIGEHSLNASIDAKGREAYIARDIRRWREVSSKTTAKPYHAYLKEFPKGMFADFAQQRIARFSFTNIAKNTSTSADDGVQVASLDVTRDSRRIADALSILGFSQPSRSAVDIDDLEASAAAYRASLGENAALTADNLFADASRLILYLGGSVGKQIQIDIAALSSVDQTLIIAQDAFNELVQIAGDDPAAKPIVDQAKLDIQAIERNQTEILAQLDQERTYYEDLMSRANENFSEYMVDRTIGAVATRSFETTDGQQTERAKLFLTHVKQAANAETRGTYSWLSDFLPKS